MGSGKSTYIFKDINSRMLSESPPKLIYVSPYLDEVGDPSKQQPGRIQEECPLADFQAPQGYPSKGQDLKRLLALGENICCTHKLFQDMDLETAEQIKEGGYEVIIDEALETIQSFDKIKSEDVQVIKQFITVDPETQAVCWPPLEPCGRYADIKKLCEQGRLFYFNGVFFLWELPPGILTSAKQVTICTYMFRASVLYGYLKRHAIPFEYVDNATIGLRSEARLISEAKKLITFADSPYIEKLGKRQLSFAGYKSLTPADLKTMRGMLEKLIQRHMKVKSSELIWTCFKGQKKALSGKGYSRGFLSFNTRATNEYGNRKAGIYLVNRYQQVFIDRFLKNSSAEIDGDLYGLSEMLQWIWRLRIRNGQEITLAIPSKRMRDLLQRWLGGEFILKAPALTQATAA